MIRAHILGICLLLSGAASAKTKTGYIDYKPQANAFFSAKIPGDWTPFEEETPRGHAAHIIGPADPSNGFRAAYHIHYFDKDKPGFVPSREMLSQMRRKEKATERQATAMSSWRVARKPARLVEVREKRIMPSHRLPSESVSLHHFYVLVPTNSEDYVMIKMTTTERQFLDMRKEFRRFLRTFRIVGY